ncbi:MAG TPA: NAD-dependent epimerase/dehydratase family protein [Stellaceae bacterium]|nr:NAD-dependent epimerase/dehydratase family protein [Stellaceae bacterium]
MAQFLVTGGCGFIGSHLADALVGRGHRVRILDNLSSGKRENAPAAAELVVGDITDRAVVRACTGDVDGIFHLAAVASVEQSNGDWVGCHVVNLTGCINIFDAARRSAGPGVRVVYASSAAVYGDADAVPLQETTPPHPTHPYGADKLGCELHGRVASRLYLVPTVGLRLFNVYGPRQDPCSPYSGVISIFAERLGRKAPLAIHGDGRQVRDFVAVADVVAFFIAAMEARERAGTAYNVCTGIGTTVLELAATMADRLGVTPVFEYAAARAGDIRSSIGDPGQAARQLGCTAKLSLRQGLGLLFADAAGKRG